MSNIIEVSRIAIGDVTFIRNLLQQKQQRQQQLQRLQLRLEKQKEQQRK